MTGSDGELGDVESSDGQAVEEQEAEARPEWILRPGGSPLSAIWWDPEHFMKPEYTGVVLKGQEYTLAQIRALSGPGVQILKVVAVAGPIAFGVVWILTWVLRGIIAFLADAVGV